MARRAAGLLLYRRCAGELQVLLVHPGGPWWANKDDGAWSLPKGEHDASEDARVAALREFREETGFDPAGEPAPLGTVRTSSGKTIAAWALEGDCDAAAVRSNTFALEWPPRSGQQRHFPEVDRAGWFALDAARTKLLPAQHPFLDRLRDLLGA